MGLLEADEFKHEEIKHSLSRESFHIGRKLLQSKLSGANVVAINTWDVSLLRHFAVFLCRTREVRGLNRRTRKSI